MAIVDVLGVAATMAGIVMAVSPALQIRRMLERRSSADVSLEYLGVLMGGWIIWIAYGIALGNFALIVANGVAMVVGVATIAVAWRLRHQPAPDPGGESRAALDAATGTE